jgi:hypothetical protein
MMELMKGLADNVIGIVGSGTITAEDYDTVLIPSIHEKLKNYKNRLSQNELNSTIGINSTKTAAQNGYELFLGVNNKIYMPL